ncbi:MAG: Uma2 family endonuclease [Lachnospiraceae bacterium]|nr:Uma2 family endonuclease [Lachnospiraceae bacterium]
MTLEEIRQKKKEYGYTNLQMAEKSGLPLATVQKVLGGTTRSPRYQTIQALASVFPEETLYDPKPGSAPDMVREPGTAYGAQFNPKSRYPRQGSYTIDDYLALPDDQRVELIDGVIYDMSAPTTPHQLIGGEIHALLREFLLRKKGSCIPFISPVDVQLDKDNKTMVQPDVCVVCDHTKINRARIYGAPDFVVEVLSPSTKMKDILIKMRKYQNAGVREYWMVDPDGETVTRILYKTATEEFPDGDMNMEVYPFSKPVPVGIFNDECVIDFGEIRERYSFMFDE